MQIPMPSPIDSGSRTSLIPRRRNCGSQTRRGLGFQLRPVGVQFGMPVRQTAQFLEHGGDLLRHAGAGLFGLGMPSPPELPIASVFRCITKRRRAESPIASLRHNHCPLAETGRAVAATTHRSIHRNWGQLISQQTFRASSDKPRPSRSLLPKREIWSDQRGRDLQSTVDAH